VTALQFMLDLHNVCHFQSREGKKTGRASNSEIRRWFANKAIICNAEKLSFDEEMDFPIISLVLFPNNPVTLV